MQNPTPPSQVIELWDRFSYNPLTGKLYLRTTDKLVIGSSYVDNRGYSGLRLGVIKDGKHTSLGYGKTVYMWLHGHVPSAGYHVDHINHDSHDNRPSNLRCITVRENNQNRCKQKSPGVYWNTNKGKWHAQIRHGATRKYLGLFTSEADALYTYIQECIDHNYPVLPHVHERLRELDALEALGSP